MNVLVACEFSGAVREAFRRLGHNAWSCDLREAEDGSPYHIVGDVREYFDLAWDLMIAHPPCTRLTNSGVRWLHKPPKNKTLKQMWEEFEAGCQFYLDIRNAPIPRKAIENPVMHKYAMERIGFDGITRSFVQPWWFGDKAFKSTGWELHGLPPLTATDKLTPPKKGTEEYAAWSKVHRASPGPEREREAGSCRG